MLSLAFNKTQGLKILCLGAHNDDIEIGCGGTLLKILETYNIAHVKWVVFTSNEVRTKEGHESARFFLNELSSNQKDVNILDFQDGILPQQAKELKVYFEHIKASYNPDIIFTHYRKDLHQDHQIVNQLTWNTFRNHLILEYEIQKYDGDTGNPSLYMALDPHLVSRKVEALLTYYPSQRGKHWFDEETFYALMRLRGLQSATKYAEAFYLRKGILS